MTRLDISRPVPFDGECLACFLRRMAAGCDGTSRLTDAWRASQPGATRWLVSYLENLGGFCDCEVVMNALEDGPMTVKGLVLRCDTFEDDDEDW